MASTGNLASIPRGKCRRKGSLLLAGHPNVKAISRRGTDRGTVLPAPLVQLGVVGGVGVGTSGAGQLDSDWSRIMRYAPRPCGTLRAAALASHVPYRLPVPGEWRPGRPALRAPARGHRAAGPGCAGQRGVAVPVTRSVTRLDESSYGTPAVDRRYRFNASKIVIMRKNGTFMRYNGRDPRNSRRRASQQGPVERRP